MHVLYKANYMAKMQKFCNCAAFTNVEKARRMVFANERFKPNWLLELVNHKFNNFTVFAAFLGTFNVYAFHVAFTNDFLQHLCIR